MTNALVLGMTVFFLLFSGYLTTMYDTEICPSFAEFTNNTVNETQAQTSWLDYVYNSKCEGLPSWYKLLIYTPLIIIAGRSLYP